MATNYRHNRGSVVMLKDHLIWIPRRRRAVLLGAVANRLESLLREKTEEMEFRIEYLAKIRMLPAQAPDHASLRQVYGI